MQDKYRKRYRAQPASTRLREQIAREAARRVYKTLVPPTTDEPRPGWLDAASSNDLYAAKRKAAAVLGHRLRPGDLPSDSEVREQLLALAREPVGKTVGAEPEPEPDPGAPLATLAESLDRFALYKIRLAPLESVKLNPKHHPEGDALFHSLQVFQLARDVRPYDEEFLLAALLHEVGLAIDPDSSVAAAIDALRGSVTERTLWLIEHQNDLSISAKPKRTIDESDYADDLRLLRELDQAGRVPGQPVDTLDEILKYLQGLEHESYLDD